LDACQNIASLAIECDGRPDMKPLAHGISKRSSRVFTDIRLLHVQYILPLLAAEIFKILEALIAVAVLFFLAT